MPTSSLSRRLLLVGSGLLTCGTSFAADAPPQPSGRGPFGLTWGMTSDDVRKMGVVLTPQPTKDLGITFSATKLPKVLSDAELVVLAFGFDDHLFRVNVVGETNGADPYGGKTISRYGELVTVLGAHYGTGTETDRRDTSVWKEPNEYVMSLRQGRAFRYTNFSTPETSVEVSVRGQDADNSYWVIIFESVTGVMRFQQAMKKREQDAL